MPSVEIRPLTSEDIAEAASLLADRHRRDRTHLPFLNKTFDDALVCAELVRSAMREEHFATAALIDGRLVGFLIGEMQLFDPRSLPAQFIPPYTLTVPLHGHAVASEVDAVSVYRLLYGDIAGRAVERGFFEHRVHIVPGDRDVEEAWVNLGFGRAMVCAIRDTVPPAKTAAPPAGVQIDRASSEDIDVVMRLEDANDRHHYGSPIFWPFLHAPRAAARDYQKALLSDANSAHFVAYKGSEPLGMNTFNPPEWVNPLLKNDKMVYLFQGIVEEDARGMGVGRALLERSMKWAGEAGYEWCALHYASANPSGAPFWQSQGFVAAEYTMSRHIDERIAWARP